MTEDQERFTFQRGVRAWATRRGMSLMQQVSAGVCLLEAVEVMRRTAQSDHGTEIFKGTVQMRPLSDGRQQAVLILLWSDKEGSRIVEQVDMMGGVGVTREEALEDLLDVVEGFAVEAGIMPRGDYWGMSSKEPLQA